MQVPFRRPQFVLIALLFEGGLGCLAWLLGWLLDVPALADLEWRMNAIAQGAVACLPLLLVFLLIFHIPLGNFQRIRRLIDEVIRPLFQACSLWDLAVICLVAGLGEEMLFRAVLQGWLTRWPDPGLALALASLAFGLMHPITFTYAVVAALFGAYLGWLWIASGNLLVAVVAHALYDFLVLVYLLRVDQGPVRSPDDPSSDHEQDPLLL